MTPADPEVLGDMILIRPYRTGDRTAIPLDWVSWRLVEFK